MKVLGPPAGLVELINHFTTKKAERESQDKTKFNPLRPSSAGKCARELAYEYAQYKGLMQYDQVVEPPEVQRLLALGHAVEYHTIKEVRKAFGEAGGGVKFKYGQQTVRIMPLIQGWIEGSVDGTIIAPEWGILLDFKSKKDKFSKIFKTGWDGDNDSFEKRAFRFGEGSYWISDLNSFIRKNRINDPFFCNNLFQLNLYYFDEHSFFQELGIDCCSVLQYNKNDSRLREVRFKPDPGVASYVKDKFKRVDHAVVVDKNPELVEKEFDLGSVKCAFCNWQEFCHSDDAKKAYFNTLPRKYWPKDTSRMDDQKIALHLEVLYAEWRNLDDSIKSQADIEQRLLIALDKVSCNKVKFSDGKVFDVKTLKTGGPANGPRKVLRESKL